MFTQKGIKRFNESRFRSRKVKRRTTSSLIKLNDELYDYNDKMKTILNDTTKFLDLGPVTNKIPLKLNRGYNDSYYS